MVAAVGTGSVKYSDALAAIFIEGIIFVILSVTGMTAQHFHPCLRGMHLM